MPYAKIVNNKIVYPPHNDGNKVNVHEDLTWLSENGFTIMSDAEIAPYIVNETPEYYTQRQIRLAMRALGMETLLDSILDSDAIIKRDWLEAQGIDFNNSTVISAITEAGITSEQITALKNKILETL